MPFLQHYETLYMLYHRYHCYMSYYIYYTLNCSIVCVSGCDFRVSQHSLSALTQIHVGGPIGGSTLEAYRALRYEGGSAFGLQQIPNLEQNLQQKESYQLFHWGHLFHHVLFSSVY